jgi:short-subunit dehydrogenase
MPNVAGRTALVTGASSGIGREVAKRLASNGFQVFATARSLEKMDDLASIGATVLRMDISKEDEIGAFAAAVLERVEAVDVLVNNAGFGLYGPIEELSIDQARYQFEVNVFGPARLTQLLLPAMRAQRSGTIVNISSMGGKIYTLLGGWYHASKHALEGWSDCLRLELAPFGIKVVVIEPGLVDTGFGDVAAAGLLEGSAEGPYQGLAQMVAAATRRAYQPGHSTAPGAVADVVLQAIAATNPKTRYVVGKYAMPMIAIRKWLGDRAFDRVMMMQMR